MHAYINVNLKRHIQLTEEKLADLNGIKEEVAELKGLIKQALES